MAKDIFDVIIIGGGPAGLNAGIILARCLRKVIIFDNGLYRNRFSDSLHGFLSRDGINPAELVRMGQEELDNYKVTFSSTKIVEAAHSDCFVVTDKNGKKYYSRKMLLATGVTDVLPPIDGIEKYYGKSVFHCPYCDGYENKDKIVGIYGQGKSGSSLASSLMNWSSRVKLFTDGKKLSQKQKQQMEFKDVQVFENKIESLIRDGEMLKGIVMEGGEKVELDCLFFSTRKYQRSNLADQLGCRFNNLGQVKVNNKQETNIDGLFVAGDAAKEMQLAIIAAAAGAKAAVSINEVLIKESLLIMS